MNTNVRFLEVAMRFRYFLPFLLGGCLAIVSAKANATVLADFDKNGLVYVGYQALLTGDATNVKPLLMTLERYKKIPEIQEALDGPDSEKVLQGIQEQASLAEKYLTRSFSPIRRFLIDELEFDFGEAKLVAVIVKAPRKDKGFSPTKWIKYSPSDKRQNLSVRYVIESNGNYAVIKLKGTFLVDNKRYLGHGFYLKNYRPKKGSKKSIYKTLWKHGLVGFFPDLSSIE